jgi:alpha-L-fucosidase
MRWPVALAAVAAVAAATELGATAAAAAAQPIEARAAPPLPSARQRDYIGWGLEMFVHFSITTFTGSQTGDQDPRAFAPDPKTLNVSQWVATAKALGAPVVALTAKHEAGFCIWPSNYSNYTIAASPTVGHRDLVREFVDECHKQDILPGFYFTTGAWCVRARSLPLAIGSASHARKDAGDARCCVLEDASLQQPCAQLRPPARLTSFFIVRARVRACSRRVPSGPYCRAGASAGECDFEYQKNQITELATQYGDIAYWWFDHHNSDPVHEMYDQVVAKYLPHAVRMGPDSWLTGEESGFAHYPLYYGCDTNDNTSYGRCLKPQAGSGSPTGAIFKVRFHALCRETRNAIRL